MTTFFGIAARALRRASTTEYERPKGVPVQEKLQDVVQAPAVEFVEDSDDTVDVSPGDATPDDIFMPVVNVLHQAITGEDDEKVLNKIKKLPGYDNLKSLTLRDVDR